MLAQDSRRCVDIVDDEPKNAEVLGVSDGESADVLAGVAKDFGDRS